MNRRRLLPALALLALASPAPVRSEPPPTAAVRLEGVGHGTTILPDPYFRWTPAPKDPRAGVLGTVAGASRDFENIELEVGADRRVLGAPLRAGYEAYRIKHDVERGEPQVADVRAELAIVRIKNPFREAVYATALKQVGRTTIFVRGTAEKKFEASLAKLLTSMASTAKGTGDDVDGWLPPEVKATWTHTPSGEFVVSDDGTVEPAKKDAIVKVVHDAFALVKRVVGGANAVAFLPVVRITGNRDLFAHLARRRDLGSAQAWHLDVAAELLVSPKGDTLDAPGIAAEAAKLALHYLVGIADAEPVRTGLARMAAAAATPGAPPGSLLKAGEEAALARAKGKEAKTWYRLLMMSTLVGFLDEEGGTRAIDAELSMNYLALSPAPSGKASLAAWAAGIRKWGHVDAGAEAGVGPLDGTKADAEFWAYWTPRADPPKKPGAGKGK